MNISSLLECVFSSGVATLWRLVDFVLQFASMDTQTFKLINAKVHSRNIKQSAATGSLQSLISFWLIPNHLTDN